MTIHRRTLLKAGLMSGVAAALPARAAARPGPATARAGWLDGAAPDLSLGTTFGVPWPEGRLRDAARLAAGAVPMQSWPLAWWPDGSLKWTAHAIGADTDAATLSIASGRAAAHAAPLRVTETADAVRIASGDTVWTIAKAGDAIVSGAQAGGRPALSAVRLVAGVAADPDGAGRVALNGRTTACTVEQRGPVRAVVKLEGVHAGEGRQLLPFVVRLYAYAGSPALRIVHSIVHDGDPATDFVSGLGVEATVPLAPAALHDRHVRLALDDGRVFAEGVRPLTGLRRDPGRPAREAQIAGRGVDASAMRTPVPALLDRIPAWGDMLLRQPSANGATLAKRTRPGHAWVPADQATRAAGLGWLGTPSGGAAIGQRWFWQRHPAAVEVAGAAGDSGTLTAWLHDPHGAPMDMRSYRGVDGMAGYAAQNEGLDITYEDYEPGWDDARGIARTSELTLWALPATPDADAFAAMARAAADPPRMVVAPETAAAAGVFGDWGLPDRSTPARARIEDQLVELTDFYDGEVDRRSWYGFWDHGDVMHSYDADRRQWRYDIGGYAWANSELSPDLWLWYQALRTADPKTWRLAEAMTRHTGEVDVYHLGRFRGLGTRHGVQHFSDSSKQPRVSTAAYRRIFYYLTADERVGDLMRDLLDSGERLETIEIGRKVPGGARDDAEPGVVGMAFGTVWASLAAAWLTEWERTRDRRWRDRLAAGMETIGALPTGWFTGSAPYELASGRFRAASPRIAFSHLNSVFGAVEVNAELIRLIDVPAYRRTWLDYCRWYNAPRAAFEARWGPRNGSTNLREGHSRLTAYAARGERDAGLAARAAAEFYSGDAGLGTRPADPRVRVSDRLVEWPGISTNAAAQWGLAAIQNLALVPEALDAAWPSATGAYSPN